MNRSFVLGVDIGGSHITAAWVDIDKGIVAEGSMVRMNIDSRGSAEEILHTWCLVIQKAMHTYEVDEACIGIAMPGPFDYDNGISLIKEQDKFQSLYNLNVKELLADKIGINPESISFVNDAAAFLQGEVLGGAGKGHEQVMGVTLGTGLGSAVYVNGMAADAALWEVSFKDGIAEDYLSTRWFVAAYKEATGKNIRGVKEMVALINEDKAVLNIFETFSEHLALFITQMCHNYHCEAVVIGGNIAKAAGYFLGDTIFQLKRSGIELPVRTSTLGEYSAMIGAAGFAYNNRIKMSQPHNVKTA